ncbi:MAG: hypothetical protein P8N61_09130, partial [Porticoccaceae bacterium]|nr:hypothetical protein [Porticoccaceae bacterium]
MKLKPYLPFFYLMLLLSSVSSYADTDGPTFTSGITQLNSATTSGDQINPSIASLPGNQFVMT